MSDGPAHLDPVKILATNARRLADERRRLGEDFPGEQMILHRKPNAGGGPCDVCGCAGLRLGVDHRALTAMESMARGGFAYVKVRMDCTHDTVETHLTWAGQAA